jgi:hypothetical protein
MLVNRQTWQTRNHCKTQFNTTKRPKMDTRNAVIAKNALANTRNGAKRRRENPTLCASVNATLCAKLSATRSKPPTLTGVTMKSSKVSGNTRNPNMLLILANHATSPKRNVPVENIKHNINPYKVYINMTFI